MQGMNYKCALCGNWHDALAMYAVTFAHYTKRGKRLVKTAFFDQACIRTINGNDFIELIDLRPLGKEPWMSTEEAL